MIDGSDQALPYRHVAWAYDALASSYSLGAIDRAKAFHHSLVNKGDRVLYAGAGRGREVVGACQRGAEVTCVEPCPAMASRLHRRLSQSADNFNIIPRPIQQLTPEPSYDLVIAHFFLNVFDERSMPGVLAHLCQFVKPGGRIVIADFKPSDKNTSAVTRGLRTVNYRPLNLAGWLLRICALHPIYNYAPVLAKHEMTLTHREAYRPAPCLPACYETITAIAGSSEVARLH